MFHNKEKNLLEAARANDTNRAITIIHSGLKDINYCDRNGNSTLLWAVKNNNETLVKEVLSLGGNVHVKNNNGFTPVILATMNNLQNILSILHGRGVEDDEKFNAHLLFNKLINGKRMVTEFDPSLIDINGLNEYSARSLIRYISLLSKHCGVPSPRITLGVGTRSAIHWHRMAQYKDGVILLYRIEGSYSAIIAGVLVHEFAHYYIDIKQLRWLDGSDLNKHEILVDNAAVFLGFGKVLLMGKKYFFNAENLGSISIDVGYLSYSDCLEAYRNFSIIQKIIDL